MLGGYWRQTRRAPWLRLRFRPLPGRNASVVMQRTRSHDLFLSMLSRWLYAGGDSAARRNVKTEQYGLNDKRPEVETVLEKRIFFIIAELGVILTGGCGVPQDQIIGVWTQPGEHFVDAAPCGSHCMNEHYEVIWKVTYPDNLRLVNFRLICRNMGNRSEGSESPCLFDEEVSIDDDRLDHRATIYCLAQSTAVAVRLAADEIR
jgi:hypothetical protein